ncbi:antigen peptide transporter 2 [Aplochiton taeniatus]
MGIKTCVLAVLICDWSLWGALWTGLILLECSGCGLLVLWVHGTLRFTLLHTLTIRLTDGKAQPVLHKWVTALSLLLPLYESGRALILQDSTYDWRPIPDPGMVILNLFSTTVACLSWEAAFPDARVSKKNKQDAKALLMRVVGYFRDDVLHLVAAFFFLILGVVCETFIPQFQGKVIDVLSGQHQISFTYAIGGLALVSLGSSMCSGLRGSMFMWSLSRLNNRIKHMLFRSLLQQDISFFEKEENQPGRLTSRLHSDVDRMGRTVALNVNVLVRSIVKTSLMLWLMLGLSWELTLLTCIEMPLLALIQNKYTTLGQDLKDQVQDCQAEAKELAFQAIKEIQTVRSFRAEKIEWERYNHALDKMYEIKKRKGLFSAIFLLLRRVVSLSIKVAMLFFGRRLLSSGQLTIGSLLTFLLYQKHMLANMREIMFGFGEMVSTVGVIAKVFAFLDRKPQQKEAGDFIPTKLQGRLVFHNVTFSYSSRPDTQALKSVTLELRAGKMTALVGPSGGGKSSCVSMLKMFYEPQEGQILLDGKPLHCYQHHYLHQKMALVSQDPVLFSGSVRYNIEYGLRGCTLEKVIKAAKKANAHGFICDMEKGYDTDVGELGGQLSIGQKQCIAIARALVREPQILILDEATNSLDINMQNQVQAVLAGSAGQTVLIVAHRLETVEKADHIIFMEDGTVVEQGTHQELMARKGRYHRLKEELFAEPNLIKD